MTSSSRAQLEAEVEALQQEVSSLEQKLSKKKLFESSLVDVISLVKLARAKSILAATLPSFESFFRRVRISLRSRYTNPVFWTAAETAAKQCQALVSDSKLSAVLQELADECTERSGDVPNTPTPTNFLFEGQLSNQEVAQPAHGENPGGRPEQLQQALDAAAALAEALTGAQMQDDTPSEDHQGIDEEAIAAFLQATENQEPPRRAPKAGRRAVKQLEVISPIDAATLERLGGPGTACSICTEALEIGDTAQVMPCSDAHVFHPDCLKPWFLDNNSCPICRHELETDDAVYEYKKVLEKERAEANKGAANAQSHNEFIYM